MKSKEQKRNEAEARAKAYANRTPAEQEALLNDRPGASAKEREKLAKGGKK